MTSPHPLVRAALLLLLCLAAVTASAKPRDGRRKDNALPSQKFGRVVISVRQEILSKRISGQLLPADRIPKEAADFFQAMQALPESFIARSGLQYVTFLSHVEVNGITAGGVASGDTIYLPVGVSRHAIYHELFHVFDPEPSDKKWTRLNDREFIYTGSQYYAADLSRSKEKKMTRNLEEKRFSADFVSRYAMSNEREDRAETFAAMVVEGPAFLRRTARSAVLKRKMEYIIEVTGKRKLLGRDFWAKRGLVENRGQ